MLINNFVLHLTGDSFNLFFILLGLAGAVFNLYCDYQVLVSLYGSIWFWIYLCPILVPGIFVVGSHFKPECSNWKDLETWASIFLIFQPLSMVLFPILYFFGCKSLILKVFIFFKLAGFIYESFQIDTNRVF